ncbi:MAG TPA: LytR C-terminal domain-containing protein, partial [Candidatus Andersenbacteria bacterium]|nr:LytR C-terminal domain-containing protein [Candidatus Andersenbacteria bacterium]
ASVLRPRTGNWGEIQQVAQNIFATPTVPDSSTPPATPPPAGGPTPTPTPAVAVIEIRNGTAVTGLAARYRDQLEESGFEVSSIGNAATRNLTQTSVFLINQTREDAAKKLAEQFSVAVQTGIPAGETSTNADVLIILGNDADN